MSPFMPLDQGRPDPEEERRRMPQLQAMKDAVTMGGATHFEQGGSPFEFASGLGQGFGGGAVQGVDSILGLAGGGLPDGMMMDANDMAAKNP